MPPACPPEVGAAPLFVGKRNGLDRRSQLSPKGEFRVVGKLVRDEKPRKGACQLRIDELDEGRQPRTVGRMFENWVALRGQSCVDTCWLHGTKKYACPRRCTNDRRVATGRTAVLNKPMLLRLHFGVAADVNGLIANNLERLVSELQKCEDLIAHGRIDLGDREIIQREADQLAGFMPALVSGGIVANDLRLADPRIEPVAFEQCGERFHLR